MTTKTEARATLAYGAMALLAIVALVLLLIGVLASAWGVAIAGAVFGAVALAAGLAGIALRFTAEVRR